LADTSAIDAPLENFGLSPDKRSRGSVEAFDEGVDVLTAPPDRCEGHALQGFPCKDRESDLDLIEPGRPCRRKVKPHIGMMLEPAVVLGQGVDVVEHTWDGGIPIGGEGVAHEVEKLEAPQAFSPGQCSHYTEESFTSADWPQRSGDLGDAKASFN
jgi:hypothetical protein